MSRFKSIIFDLDGTLANSLPGIEESARAAISSVLPGEPVPDLRAVIGPPVATMFAMLLPDLEEERMGRLIAEFRAHYDSVGFLRTESYPGAKEVLAHLHSAGMELFVLTNKPIRPAEKILDHLGLAAFFTAVMAPDSVEPPFRAKTDGARLLVEKFRLISGSTVLVGDGMDDVHAAQACGFEFIAAAYGYGRAAAQAEIVPLATLKMLSQIETVLF